jgi:purine-nucleoside/S-methyl-5'-thioadenosine phosphorylase / adenosine deaminase
MARDQLAEYTTESGPDRIGAPWRVPKLLHGFLGRAGGVSKGLFASLNLSYWVGDEPASVDRNWQVARGLIAPDAAIARLNQVHGNTVRTIGADFAEERLQGDGMVTAIPGIVLAILTADCVPILMADAERGVVGALHAGWRGTLAAIARGGVDAMAAMGARPESIRAALGPSIGPCCFEVDRELALRFAEQVPGAMRHSRPGPAAKAFLDLRGVIRDQLEACGLDPGAIASVGPCTRCAGERYFSRRAAGGGITGLQLSYIGLAGPGRV